MSLQNPKESENPSGKNLVPSSKEEDSEEEAPMTRAQALAVGWTGLEVLALTKQMRIINDPRANSLILVIANARVEVLAAGTKKKLKLIDLLVPVANTEEV